MIIWMDPFDIAFDDTAWYNAAKDFSVVGTSPRTGDGCIEFDINRLATANSGYIIRMFDQGYTELYAGFAVYLPSSSTHSQDVSVTRVNLFSFLTNYETEPMTVTLAMNTSYELELWTGSDTTAWGTLLGTSSSTLSRDTWYFLEIHICYSDAAGEIELRIDGTQEIKDTNVDTANGTGDGIYGFILGVIPEDSYKGTAGWTMVARFDDLSVNDISGGVAVGWPNQRSVYAIVCDGSEGDDTDFAYSGGGDGPTNMADLVSFGNYVDANYAYGSAAGAHTWGLTAPAGSGSVEGLMLLSYTASVLPGAAGIQHRLINPDGSYDFDAFYPANFGWNIDLVSLDPNTGQRYTISGLGTTQLGIVET